MYLALARKYRPQNFNTLVGQDYISRTLKNAIRLNRVHHAYLFTGCRGIGKTSTARILAKALNCESTGERPCNHCESCLEINEDKSLDVFEIDGASNRGIEEIRDLKERIKFTPVKSKYKIYIIDEVHMLTGEAFNALLKTLEEPPSYVVFIFATTVPEKVPATILSRCQRFDFFRIPVNLIVDYLEDILDKEKIEFEKAALGLIAWAADGSLRDSLSLLDMIISYSDKNITAETVKKVLGMSESKQYPELILSMYHNNTKKVFEIINEASKRYANILRFIEGLIHFVRAILEVKVVGEHYEWTYPLTDKDSLKNLAETIDESFLEYTLELLLKVYEWSKKSSFPENILIFALHRISKYKVEPATLQEISEKMMNLYYMIYSGESDSGKVIKNAAEKQDNLPSQPVSRNLLMSDDEDEKPSDNEFEENVELFLKDLDKEYSKLRALLNPVNKKIKDKKIIFYLESDFHNKEIEKNRSVIEVVFNKYLSGFNLSFIVKGQTKSKDEPAESVSQKKKEFYEVRKNPLVKGVMDIFEGDIVSIDGEEEK